MGLVDRILEEVPELSQADGTDFQRVCLIRQWASRNLPVALYDAQPLDMDARFGFYDRDAPDIFDAFERQLGGVACGGASYALARLYQHFGFEAYLISSGLPGTPLTHTFALVRISHEGRAVLTVQDALFDATVIDPTEQPRDYLEWLRGGAASIKAAPDSDRLIHDGRRFRRERWGYERFAGGAAAALREKNRDPMCLFTVPFACWAATEAAARALRADVAAAASIDAHRLSLYFARAFPKPGTGCPAIELADAVRRRRGELAEVQGRLREMWGLVESPADMTSGDLLLFYALLLEYRPSLIFEVGRGFGNSTCAFTEYANRAGCRVASVCHSDGWRQRTAPRLEPLVGARWFEPLEARRADLLEVDLKEILGDHRRIFFFWDAHGAGLAEYVIARVFPELAARGALVAVHDIQKIVPGKTPHDLFRVESGERVLWMPPFMSAFPELVFIHDFLTRHGIAPGAAAGAGNLLPVLGLGDPAGAAFIHFELLADRPYAFPDYRGGASAADIESACQARPPVERWRIELDADDWPVAFTRNDEARTPLTHVLMRCAVDRDAELHVMRYGASGGLSVDSPGRFGRYSAGHPQDHCGTPYCDATGGRVFFSVWVRGTVPRVVLQNEHCVEVAGVRTVEKRGDGWTLLAGIWTPPPGAAPRVRVVARLPWGAEADLRRFFIAQERKFP